MHRRIAALLAAAIISVPARSAAECVPAGTLAVDGLGTPPDDLARVAELAGAVAPQPRLVRRGGSRGETVCADVGFPWPPFARPTGSVRPEPFDSGAGERSAGTEVRALPLRLSSVWNSRYPSGDNDGLLWAGRGLSQLATAGVALRYGPVSGAIAPEAAWSENHAFELRPNGLAGDLQFGNAYYPAEIDLPQRFGARAFTAFAPGQSYLRADLWNVGVGISSENLWIGPGVRSSILMSNAGPGFPHVFVGTSRPGDIWIGKGEAFLFWGRLDRSRFIEGGGHPMISGLVVGYEPRWIPGLHLGLGRVMLQTWDRLRLRDWFAVFQPFQKQDLQSWFDDGNNPFDNQLASVFGRWVFPSAGLEIYGEWAREDHDWTWWGFIRDPDHSQAYLVGLQKIFRAGANVVRLHAELAHLQEVRPPASDRGMPVYYIHGNDLGYTNGGQLLGAWIGPGADSQTLAVDVFHRGGRIGGYLERVRRNDAYYWAVIEPTRGSWAHDAELAFGVRQALSVGPVEVSWEAAAAWRQNRDFLHDEPNLKAVLGLAMPVGR